MSKFFKIPSLNSIYTKIAAVILLTTGCVVVTITTLQGREAATLLNTAMSDLSEQQTELLSDLIAGGVKFKKGDQVDRVLGNAIASSEGRISGSVAVSLDGAVISQLGEEIDAGLPALAEQAASSGELALSQDGNVIAIPVRFGPQQAIVGAVALRWTHEATEAALRESQTTVLAIAGGVFLIAAATALFAMGKLFFQPLRAFGGSIRAMEQEEYESSVPYQSRKDEVGGFGRTLEALRLALMAGAEAKKDARDGSAAFRGTSACLMLLDENLMIKHLNQGMVNLFKDNLAAIRENMPNFDPDNLKGSPIEAFHPDSTPIRRALEASGDKPFEALITFGDTTVSLKVVRSSGKNNETTGYVLEWSDITQTIINEAVMSAINSGQMMVKFNKDGFVQEINENMKEEMSFTEEELGRKALHGIAKPSSGSDLEEVLAKVLEGSEKTEKIVFQTEKAGRKIVAANLSCIKDRRGRATGVLLLGQNVTKEEEELARVKEDQRRNQESQEQVVEALKVALKRLEAGDLTTKIEKPFDGAYEALRADFNNTTEKLNQAMIRVADDAEKIFNETSDISSTTDGLSRRTETTAATLEQAAAALDELTTSVKANANGAVQADEAATNAKGHAAESGKIVVETVQAMDKISDSSEKITSIIKVIDDIAFQTNLLALNAGVEAARAGDAGRGFAVVASEVRELAQRSSEAAKEISDLISKSGGQVKTGVNLVGQTGQALKSITASVNEISDLISEMASAARDQSNRLGEINESVNSLDQSTQQNAARLEETTAASEALKADSESLVKTVNQFVLLRSEGKMTSRAIKPPEIEHLRNSVKPKEKTRESPKNLSASALANTAVQNELSSGWHDF